MQDTPIPFDVYDNVTGQSNKPKKSKRKRKRKKKQEKFFYSDDDDDNNSNGVSWKTLPILT